MFMLEVSIIVVIATIAAAIIGYRRGEADALAQLPMLLADARENGIKQGWIDGQLALFAEREAQGQHAELCWRCGAVAEREYMTRHYGMCCTCIGYITTPRSDKGTCSRCGDPAIPAGELVIHDGMCEDCCYMVLDEQPAPRTPRKLPNWMAQPSRPQRPLEDLEEKDGWDPYGDERADEW